MATLPSFGKEIGKAVKSGAAGASKKAASVKRPVTGKPGGSKNSKMGLPKKPSVKNMVTGSLGLGIAKTEEEKQAKAETKGPQPHHSFARKTAIRAKNTTKAAAKAAVKIAKKWLIRSAKIAALKAAWAGIMAAISACIASVVCAVIAGVLIVLMFLTMFFTGAAMVEDLDIEPEDNIDASAMQNSGGSGSNSYQTVSDTESGGGRSASLSRIMEFWRLNSPHEIGPIEIAELWIRGMPEISQGWYGHTGSTLEEACRSVWEPFNEENPDSGFDFDDPLPGWEFADVPEDEQSGHICQRMWAAIVAWNGALEGLGVENGLRGIESTADSGPLLQKIKEIGPEQEWWGASTVDGVLRDDHVTPVMALALWQGSGFGVPEDSNNGFATVHFEADEHAPYCGLSDITFPDDGSVLDHYDDRMLIPVRCPQPPNLRYCSGLEIWDGGAPQQNVAEIPHSHEPPPDEPVAGRSGLPHCQAIRQAQRTFSENIEFEDTGLSDEAIEEIPDSATIAVDFEWFPIWFSFNEAETGAQEEREDCSGFKAVWCGVKKVVSETFEIAKNTATSVLPFPVNVLNSGIGLADDVVSYLLDDQSVLVLTNEGWSETAAVTCAPSVEEGYVGIILGWCAHATPSVVYGSTDPDLDGWDIVLLAAAWSSRGPEYTVSYQNDGAGNTIFWRLYQGPRQDHAVGAEYGYTPSTPAPPSFGELFRGVYTPSYWREQRVPVAWKTFAAAEAMGWQPPGLTNEQNEVLEDTDPEGDENGCPRLHVALQLSRPETSESCYYERRPQTELMVTWGWSNEVSTLAVGYIPDCAAFERLGENDEVALKSMTLQLPETYNADGQLETPTQVTFDIAPCLEQAVEGLWAAAGEAGVRLIVSSTYRTVQSQKALRAEHCPALENDINHPLMMTLRSSQCTPWVAIPGTSYHNAGLAIDFKIDNIPHPERSGYYVPGYTGGRPPSGETETEEDIAERDHRAKELFAWLQDNACRFGFGNVISEPWHWDVGPPSPTRIFSGCEERAGLTQLVTTRNPRGTGSPVSPSPANVNVRVDGRKVEPIVLDSSLGEPPEGCHADSRINGYQASNPNNDQVQRVLKWWYLICDEERWPVEQWPNAFCIVSFESSGIPTALFGEEQRDKNTNQPQRPDRSWITQKGWNSRGPGGGLYDISVGLFQINHENLAGRGTIGGLGGYPNRYNDGNFYNKVEAIEFLLDPERNVQAASDMWQARRNDPRQGWGGGGGWAAASPQNENKPRCNIPS